MLGKSAMNGQLLIDAIVQQVTVPIAQLATSGGLRAPVSCARVEAFNRQAGLPLEFLEVVSYVGQCVIERENEASEDANEDE